MKGKLILLIVACEVLTASAQEKSESNVFRHMDASVTLGTTGIGIGVSSPVGDYVQLRTGFDIMPRFHYNASFGVQVGDDPKTSVTKFENLSKRLEQMTGYKVDDKIDVIGVPTFYNFHFLVDVFPFKENKHWHVTAGFYWGNSQIGEAYNTTADMASLLAVGIYNQMYEKAIAYEPLISFGNYTLDDPQVQDELYRLFSYYGRMGYKLAYYSHDILDANGNVVHAEGDTYIIEPDVDCMVKGEVKANSFKPYLGIGYTGRLLKGNDKFKISFDCGAMFWGGKPRLLTHDGTDLVYDVYDVKGKAGDYVELIKAVKVFPVLNVRFTCPIF